MVDLIHCLTNFLFFDIPLLYCYTNLNSLIICCLSLRGIYLSFDVDPNSLIISRNIHPSFGTNLNSSIICCFSSGDMYLFFGTFTSAFISILASSFFAAFLVETLVVLSAIFLPIKSLVASAAFWIALFDAVFITSRSFWPYLLLKVLQMIFAKDKTHILLHLLYLLVQLNVSFL